MTNATDRAELGLSWSARAAHPGVVAAVFALHGLLFLGIFLALYPTVAHVDANSLDIMQRDLAVAYQFNNPPLYEWLMWAVGQVEGFGRATPLILRYGLMAAIGLAFYGLVLDLTGRRLQAAAAAYALFSFYFFAWFFHEAATHSIAVALCGIVFLWCVVRFLRRPTWAAAILIGLATGLGLIAKLNFAILIASCLATLATDRALRRHLLDLRWLAAVAVALCIAAPVMFGVADLGRSVFASSAIILTRGSDSHLIRSLTGAAQLPLSIALFLSPWLPIAAVVWWWERRRGVRVVALAPVGAPERFLLRLAVVGPLLALAGVILVGVTSLSERYMLTIALPAVVAFHVVVASAMDQRRLVRAFAAIAAVVMTVCLLLRVAAGVTGGYPERRENKRMDPFDRLAAELTAKGLGEAFFIANDRYEAGNLIAALPAAHAAGLISQRARLPHSYPVGGRCVLFFKGRFQVMDSTVEPAAPSVPDLIRPLLPPGAAIETILIPWHPTLIGADRIGLFHWVDLGRDADACRKTFGSLPQVGD